MKRASQPRGIFQAALAAAWLLSGTWTQAAVVQFTQQSNPAGLFTTNSTAVESSTSATSLTAAASINGYRFTHWEVQGVRQNDVYGRGKTSFSTVVYENTTAVAQYLLETLDSDVDGVPDWFEIHYMGDLTRSAADDSDNDQLSLINEYKRGYHPHLPDGLSEGGFSRRRSESSLVIQNPLYALLKELSDPPGILANERAIALGTTVTLATAPTTYNNTYHWVGWFQGSTRLDKPLVPAPQTLVMSAATTVTARYVDDSIDSDVDGISDWYEWFFFTSLSQAGDSDSDGDGISVSVEKTRGYSPLLTDNLVEGGISRRQGELSAVNLAGLSTCRILSNPPGIQNTVTTVPNLTTITTPNLLSSFYNGYYFAYWERDGVQQRDANGIALGELSFSVSQNTTATAFYLLGSQDNDADGVADWYELRYFPNLTQNAGSDADGDNVSLQVEATRNYHPRLKDTLAEGGISRRRGELTTINLQPYESLTEVQVKGKLEGVFSDFPESPSGWNFGPAPAPALGDWDGDGDLDLFVTSQSGLLVYQNKGTPYKSNLSNETSNFTAVSNALSGMTGALLAIGDWSRDGHADLVISGGGSNLVFFKSSGQWNTPTAATPDYVLAAGLPGALPALGDLNNDSRPDLLLIGTDGIARVYWHTGYGAAPYSASNTTDNFLGMSVPGSLSAGIADINFDSIPDVLLSDTAGRIWEFRGQEGSSPTLYSKVWAGTGENFADGLRIAVADWDGDGDADYLGGVANGGLIARMDPRVGRPMGLTLAEGAKSINLEWIPDRQSRIAGYEIYRATQSTANPFNIINMEPVTLPRYKDSPPSLTTLYHYYVTALSKAFYPGNTLPVLVESPRSDTVSGAINKVVLSLRDKKVKAGAKVKFDISIDNAADIRGQGMQLDIQYPTGQLTPVSQVDSDEASITTTGLSRNLEFIDNGLIANGHLLFSGTGGTLKNGSGKMLTLHFVASGQLAKGTRMEVSIPHAEFYDNLGNPLAVTIRNVGYVIVDAAYQEGDINGDGVVSKEDKTRLLALLKPKAAAPTEDELSAGDLNNNGILDQNDLVLLVRLLDGLSVDE
ncbi:MAG: FG-GAP-like repeat-containing protein [Candidatus Methylacidiphilales bacterium]|nr:FG-GAP-like repeat-containing protein [Candidatus Methylacidiphilales bacterium]